jgi:predicted dehydrogenase
LKVALAGLGTASLQGHLPVLTRLQSERRLRLVAAADPSPARRAHISQCLPELSTFDAAEAMLEAIESDVLVVATEPDNHARLTALGMSHGQQVVCEKPLTLTRRQCRAIAVACERRPDLGVIPVHQYRYSSRWAVLSFWARLASRLRLPFSLRVDVQRDGTDKLAVSSWRDSPSSGGMLADHAVHFLALSWTISNELEVLNGCRAWDSSRRERSLASVRVGSGTLGFRASAAAPVAHTRLDLRIGPAQFTWSDDATFFSLAGCRVTRASCVGALSDRRHTDSLYLPFYRDLVGNLNDVSWRRRRTDEALTVATLLVTLLEAARGEHDG